MEPDLAVALPPTLHSVPEDVAISSSPSSLNYGGVGRSSVEATAAGLPPPKSPKKSPTTSGLQRKNSLMKGADVSALVLDNALSSGNASPGLGLRPRRTSSVDGGDVLLHEDWESLGPAAARPADSSFRMFQRTPSIGSADGTQPALERHNSNPLKPLDQNSDKNLPTMTPGSALGSLKRGLQRMMVDRNTLHEFDMQSAPQARRGAQEDFEDELMDHSIHMDANGQTGTAEENRPSQDSISCYRRSQDSRPPHEDKAGGEGEIERISSSGSLKRSCSLSRETVEGKTAVPASPASTFARKRGVTRTLSLDASRFTGDDSAPGFLQRELSSPAGGRATVRASTDGRRRSLAYQAQQRTKISTFATVLTKTDSVSMNNPARRDFDQKHLEPGGGNPGLDSSENNSSMTGSVPLHPNSTIRMVWDSVMFVATVFALVTDPISIAFTTEESGSPFFKVSDRVVMCIFFIDIILNFLTGYVDKKDQRIIMHWREVAFQYAKFWLFIDVISSLPPEAFEGFSENSVVKGARVSKLLRCFKISRLARIVQVLQLNLDIKLSHFMWKIVVWTSCCFLWVHWTTCAECFVWRVSDSSFRLIDMPNNPEIMKGGDDDCMDSAACNARFYLRGLRTAIAFMCGHDQATGSTISEDLIAVICSLTGSILYSSFIAVCISLLMEMDAERVRYMGQVERLNHYMGRRNVPMNLRQRVREYMELTWINSGGTDDYEVLAFVSRSLRRELAMHNASKLIAGVPFLQAGSEGFVFSVSQMLRPEAFMAGDDIMIRGEIGQEMFLLERGIVDIIEHDETTVIASLGPGAWFGEIALQHKTLRTATIRAHTDGNLYVLHRDDFLKLMPYFPQVAEELRKSNERIIREIQRYKQSGESGGDEGESDELACIDRLAGVALSSEVPLARSSYETDGSVLSSPGGVCSQRPSDSDHLDTAQHRAPVLPHTSNFALDEDASHPPAPTSQTNEKSPQEVLTEVAVRSSGGGDRGQRGVAGDGQQSGESKVEQQQGGVPRDEVAEDAAFAAFDGELHVHVKSARA